MNLRQAHTRRLYHRELAGLVAGKSESQTMKVNKNIFCVGITHPITLKSGLECHDIRLHILFLAEIFITRSETGV
jgi:hypothetical protein